jgi:stress response protein SCP2
MECDKGAVVKYTLDGRDPLTAGRRYKGPIYLSQPRNHLRAVTVKGKQHSQVLDVLYVVCHFAMPHEVVKGSMIIRTFPQAMDTVKKAMSKVLGFPKERVQIEKEDTDQADKYWLTTCLRDPAPRQKLAIDRPYTLVRGDKQKNQFMTNFKADVHRATGADPTGVEISAGSGDHSGIIVMFVIGREHAAEIGKQLLDPSSFLLSRAKTKAHMKEARLSVVESLADRLSSGGIREALRESFQKKAHLVELLCMGDGDTGVISTLISKNDVKVLKKAYEKCVSTVLPDCVQEGFTESPEDIELTYTIDVVTQTVPVKLDGGVVVKNLNAESTGVAAKMELELCDMGLPVAIKRGTKATSRPLNKVEFRVRWDKPHAGKDEKVLQDFVTAAFFVYAESKLAQVVDFVLGAEVRGTDVATAANSSPLGLSVSRATRSGGEDIRDPSLTVDLSALPAEATDMFIALSTFEADQLCHFPNLTVELYDSEAKRKLTSYVLPSDLETKAVVACTLSRPDGAWVLHGLALPSGGNMRHFDPIHGVISKRQDDYLRWERRQHLVKLRVMHKNSRITEASTNEFAKFMWGVIVMPIPLFQLVVRCL